MNTIKDIETLISQGRYLEVQHAAEQLRKDDSNLRLEQLYALALSKPGAPEQAQHYLEQAYTNHHEHPETAGILLYSSGLRRSELHG